MLYLIEPDGTVLMNDASIGDVRVMVRRDQRDPASLRWTEAPVEVMPHLVLTAALRHGVDIRRGLMVHGGFVRQLMEPARLREELEEQRQVERQLAGVSKGAEQDRDGFREAESKAEEAIREADKRAKELRDEPVQDKLERAWARMGGVRDAAGSHLA